MSGISRYNLFGGEKKSRGIFLDVLLVVLCVIMFAALILRQFVFFPVSVSGSSMYKTIESGDVLIIDKFAKVKRGDVVVIDMGGGVNFIKRVIGMPEETVYIAYGEVYVTRKDGKREKLDEPYAYYKDGSGKTLVNDSEEPFEITLGPDQIFFMGDNRKISHDSRAADVGSRSINDVLGVVPKWSIDNRKLITGYYGFSAKVSGFFAGLFKK